MEHEENRMPTPEQIAKMFAPLLPGLMGIELGEATQEKVVATMLVRPDLCTAGWVSGDGAEGRPRAHLVRDGCRGR